MYKVKALLSATLAITLIVLSGCAPRERAHTQSEAEGGLPAALGPQVQSEQSPPPQSVPEPPRPETTSRPPADVSEAVEDEPVAAAMSVDYAAIAELNGEKTGWGWGGGGRDDKNRPVSPVVFQDRFAKYDAYFIRPDSDKLYLTFDEGYEYGFTPAILDTLKEKNVSAVFFVTGHFAKTEPELIRRIIDEGHVLANHSDKHKNFPDLPLSEAEKDLMDLHEYIKETFEYEMKLFRFPEGSYSEQTMALVQSLGYKTLFWSFAHTDWDVNNQPLTIDALNKITENAHPGAIYLLHAVSRTNTEVLGEAIDIIRENGYEFGKWEDA